MGFLVGLIVVFHVGVLKKLVFFWLGPITSTLKIIMEVYFNN